MTALEVNVGGVKMKNPVATASGTCGYGDVFESSYPPESLGAVVVKGVSLKPRPGNKPPRMTETPCGMINAIGLENIGLDAFVKEKLPALRDKGATVVVNVFGEKEDEYPELCERLSEHEGIHGLELNISCPNVKAGGIMFGSDPSSAASLVEKARKATELPLWVKLSPNAGDVAAIAKAVVEAGADAVSLVNTFKAMAIDIEKRRPVLATVTGGLSGPAIRPIALRMVYEVSRSVDVPVVGLGGIMEPEDAIAFLLAGASAVQVGTANFVDPTTPSRVVRGIEAYLERHGMKSVGEIIGALQT